MAASARAEALAQQFEQANAEFLRVILALSEEQWRAFCPDEGRNVAALARHIASSIAIEARAFQSLAGGEPVTAWTWEQLDEVNAAQGRNQADCARDEVVELARRNGSEAVAFVRGLTDAELARTGAYIVGLPNWTVDLWIEQVLIGHIRGHLASIQAIAAGTVA